ncbi:MAG: P-loop NTPase fold protein [Prevotella sp.]
MQIGTLNIDVSEKVKDFVQYLDSTDRIILSARFGDGKTHLLNALRNDETANKEYEFFTIYPVNYSVAPNEDVFEYIKRDIIVQLNNQGLLNNIDLEATFSSFIDFEDIASVVSFILSLVPGGVVYNKFFNQFCKIKKRYEQKKHTADKYLSTFAKQKGSIYEEDGYTKLIRERIKWMGEDHYTGGHEWKGKKPVLIIEDLDRLDPKHLFRILNVISAHMEDRHTPDKVGNKFGFHSIVLVMDYDVTKHIFHHFYGDGACYEGYMSKFLSREPFRYSIKYEVVEAIENRLENYLGLPYLFSTFEKFKNKLLQSSIRDLSKLVQLDTNHYVKSSKYVITNPRTGKTTTLPTSFPIFHLLVYMIESGMTTEEIRQAFVNAEEYAVIDQAFLLEYLKLMYPIYRTHYPDMEDIRTEKDVFIFRTSDSEGMYTNVMVHPTVGTRTWNSFPSLLGNKIGDVILIFLEKVSSSINLSALNPYYDIPYHI